MKVFSRRSKRLFAALFMVLFLNVAILAQSIGGTITGTVRDPQGAGIANAVVLLTNVQTGLTVGNTTGRMGEYTFLDLPVGVYGVRSGAEGFQATAWKPFHLDVNETVTLNIRLQSGKTAEVVEEATDHVLVDITSTQLGAVINDQMIVGLPLNARDTYQFLQLQPGVQGIGGADLFYGSNQPGAVSVNGGRGRANNFSVNGGDANDLFVNAPAIQPSPDAVQEFRVLTNTFNAEFGRNSGSVINIVTRSGSNAFHGSAYEFFRNNALDAKGYFDFVNPDNRQNQFGATLGGPIKKNSTFFFSSYEERRLTQGISSDPVLVPTAVERTGNFSATPFDSSATLSSVTVASILNARPGCSAAIGAAGGVAPAPGVGWSQIFPNSVVPTACLDPVAASLVSLYVPQANSPNGVFQTAPNEFANSEQFTLKLDHKLSSAQSLNGYYYFIDGTDDQPFTRFQAALPNLLPGFGNNNATRSQQFSLADTWILSPKSVNEVRFSFLRESEGTFLHPQRTNLVTQSCTGAASSFCFTGTTDTPGIITPDPKLGITPNLGPNHEGVPFISIAGGFTIGNDYEGELPQTGNTFQWSDNFTRIWGHHTAKFGIDFRRQYFDQTLFFDPNGMFTYSGGGANDLKPMRPDGSENLFANFMLGLPDSFLQGSTQTENVRMNALNLFAQDSWKLRPDLTLNYGLRWELNTPMADSGNRIQTFRPGQATTVFPCQLSPASQASLGFPDGNCNPGGAAQAVFPLGLVVPGDKGVPPGLTQAYYGAYAPRIGIAWSPFPSHKTSIHAGYGIFYNPMEQLILEQFQGEPPFGGSSSLGQPLFSTPFISQNSDCTAATPCFAGGPGTSPNPFNGILSPASGTPVDFSIFRPIVLFGEMQSKLKAQYSEQYNLEITHELARDLVVSIGYVGSQGHRLLASRDLNPGNPLTCLDLIATLGNGACGPFSADSSFFVPPGTVIAPQGLHLPYGPVSFIPGGTIVGPNGLTLAGLRQYSSPFCNPQTGAGCPPDGIPVFSSIFSQDEAANSSYNSLQVSVDKKLSHGVQFLSAYTFSKSIDNASSFENLLDPFNFAASRSLSLFDARHRWVTSYLWQLPVPRYSGLKEKLLDNWTISGITAFQTGFPIALMSNADQELEFSQDFNFPGRPNLVAPFRTLNPRNNGGLFFPPSSFALPALGSLGNAPRTICCGPGIVNTDFSVQKTIQVAEGKTMEFRTEAFNVLNHTQFLNPDGNFSDGPNFGRVTRARSPRQIQLALKMQF
jgi:hypothetical protein